MSPIKIGPSDRGYEAPAPVRVTQLTATSAAFCRDRPDVHSNQETAGSTIGARHVRVCRSIRFGLKHGPLDLVFCSQQSLLDDR